jgi:tryptophanyl-tRNA synthetase
MVNRKIILTGDRPSGKLHLGHYVGSLQNRVKLQNGHIKDLELDSSNPSTQDTLYTENSSTIERSAVYDQFVMIADVQALTDNFENPSKITQSVYEVAMDYLAVGIDPQKTTIFIQSQIPELAELTIYYLNLVTTSRLERNPTVKAEINQKNFKDSIPAGFFCYPVSQAADISIFRAELVPVGEDQLPMIEQTNEIVRRFNRIYNTDYLKECSALLGSTSRLVGIDGKAKASKSLNNTIFLADSAAEIKNKIFQMYTDPGHIKISDPGKVEGNVVFSYLDAFFKDKDELSSLKNQYRRGGLGDSTIKNLLNETLQEFLAPIREKRESLSKKYIQEMLLEGSSNARKVAQKTMEQVRSSIGVVY